MLDSATRRGAHTSQVKASLAHDDPDAVFARIVDFTTYPTLCPDVIDVTVTDSDSAGTLESTWEVRFRGGIMIWTERDVIDHQKRTCDFLQISGDLEEFRGRWQVEADGDDPARRRVTVMFDSVFDIGVPSLADMLNPVAGRAISDNITSMINALFEGHDVQYL